MTDVVIIGAGHNGLVAACCWPAAGLGLVLEAADVLGGATRTERPFPKVPGLRPVHRLVPARADAAGAAAHPRRRHPGAAPRPALLPAHPGRPGAPYLLFGSDREATRAQLERFFSAARRGRRRGHAGRDRRAARRPRPGLAGASRCTVEETAERHIRPALQQTFIDLVRGSVVDYLARFGFKSELLMSMYAVTDGLSGLNAGPDDPGTGHNFLVHNMCRLPGSDGTWMIAEGGMGTVSRTLRRRRPRRRRDDLRPSTPGAAVDRRRRRGHAAWSSADGRAIARPGGARRLRPVPADGPGRRTARCPPR